MAQTFETTQQTEQRLRRESLARDLSHYTEMSASCEEHLQKLATRPDDEEDAAGYRTVAEWRVAISSQLEYAREMLATTERQIARNETR